MRALVSLFAICLAPLVLGCSSLHYLTQAAAGQEDINRRGIAVDEIVEGRHLDKRTRDLLGSVEKIKAFGEKNGLVHTKNYSRYVWLPRPAVVWVVSACDPIAFRPKAWKFPIVGSITYTGWFDREEARRYGADSARAGWDTDVRPSPAYSTLGYFDDPILSTMISDGDEALGDLADVVLHETLHATFYVPGQSTLNESVASFFGDHLSVRYLDEAVGPDSPEKVRYLELRARGEARGRRMREAYLALEHVYATGAATPRGEKLAEKKKIIDALRGDLQIARPVTNATLIQYKTYGSGKDELEQILKTCDGSFPRMLRALEKVKAVARAAPAHTDPAGLLRPLVATSCPL